mmetsp:Transcript_100754/g.285598  ORF Transcript_100754/g.285598 Transcript_100754/m.285598 type:complete len:653 (-) Transcript_100754:34-1992(-)
MKMQTPLDREVGMVTCAPSVYTQGQATLAYMVRLPLVLVLDRADVVEGKVIGALLFGDVLVASDVSENWVKLNAGSFVRHPQMRQGRIKLRRDGWVLREHNDYGTLLGAVSGELVRRYFEDEIFKKPPLVKTAPAKPSKKDAEENENHQTDASHTPVAGSGSSPSSLPKEMSEIDHWLVCDDAGAWIHRSCNIFGEVVLIMQIGDVLVLGAGQPPRIQWDGSTHRWLHVSEGSQVYRKGAGLFAGGGLEGSGYVLLQDPAITYVRYVPRVRRHIVIRMASGFGEPWIVSRDEVQVRAGRCTVSSLLGVLRKGDIVGARRCVVKDGATWVELVRDADIRDAEGSAADDGTRATRARSIGDVAQISVSKDNRLERDKKLSRWRALDTKSMFRGRAWVKVSEHDLPDALERYQGKFDLEDGCVITDERHKMYCEVISLCHRRIFEENLDGLWNGERDKLPTPKSLEAKLFDGISFVLHTAAEGTFAGGAIVKEIFVPAVASSSGGSLTLFKGSVEMPGGDRGITGTTAVGYIDCCAAEPGTHAGTAIWEVISKMKFVCVACHSILLQSSVDFWQSRGLRRFDVTNEKDRTVFMESILVHTMGKIMCTLPDLVEVLPSSELPLFVWIQPNLSSDCSIQNSNHVFMADGHSDSSDND